MARTNQIEKAIAALEADKAVLELAIAKLLKVQQQSKPAAKPRKVKAAAAAHE